ncbi:MAG: Ribonuclease H [uncultured bacterium]|nr:MAG: Ribonuclease H [uncultured bacterium]
MQTIDVLQINTDGGSRNNPGPSAIGVYATSTGQEVFTISQYLGVATNNEAEYQAVIYALKYLKENEIFSPNITFVLDSELIVKQITGIYKVKQPHLQALKTQVLDLIGQLNLSKQILDLKFVNVLREKNKDADRLVNLALDSLPA